MPLSNLTQPQSKHADNVAVHVGGTLLRTIARRSSHGFFAKPHLPDKTFQKPLLLTSYNSLEVHYLPQIADDFNFGQKLCPKIKPSEMFKRPKYLQLQYFKKANFEKAPKLLVFLVGLFEANSC